MEKGACPFFRMFGRIAHRDAWAQRWNPDALVWAGTIYVEEQNRLADKHERNETGCDLLRECAQVCIHSVLKLDLWILTTDLSTHIHVLMLVPGANKRGFSFKYSLRNHPSTSGCTASVWLNATLNCSYRLDQCVSRHLLSSNPRTSKSFCLALVCHYLRVCGPFLILRNTWSCLIDMTHSSRLM